MESCEHERGMHGRTTRTVQLAGCADRMLTGSLSTAPGGSLHRRTGEKPAPLLKRRNRTEADKSGAATRPKVQKPRESPSSNHGVWRQGLRPDGAGTRRTAPDVTGRGGEGGGGAGGPGRRGEEARRGLGWRFICSLLVLSKRSHLARPGTFGRYEPPGVRVCPQAASGTLAKAAPLGGSSSQMRRPRRSIGPERRA